MHGGQNYNISAIFWKIAKILQHVAVTIKIYFKIVIFDGPSLFS